MKLKNYETSEQIDKENTQSKLDMILEKLSHSPNANNDNLLRKLEEIQSQLTELRSIQTEKKVGDADVQSQTATDYAGTINVGSISTIRSLKELEDLGFTYESDSSELKCVVCQCHDPKKANPTTEKTTALTKDQGIFTYPNNLENDFKDQQFLPREFTNLKKSIKRQLTDSITHKNVKAEEERKAERGLFEKKNKKAGMNLGRLCIKLYLKGRPYTDYENDILVQRFNGSIVGELNHSRKFPAAFRPFVNKAVARRVREFISRRIPQTRHLPAVNIIADKATYKHNTRQFLSCVVSVVPGAEELLQVISFGQPIVKGHTGVELAKDIKEGLDNFKLQSCQIEGGSFDGQYFHLGVEKALESPAVYDLPPKNVLWAWMPCTKVAS